MVEAEGRERATYLLRRLLDHARKRRVQLPPVLNTPYRNSVGLADQPQFPGNLELEQRLSAIVRWNALAMVVRANRAHPELGGHIASYASAADLFEVGFNHCFRAGPAGEKIGAAGGDLVYFQPHSATGVYSRAFLEGRLSEAQLAHYRRETGGDAGAGQPPSAGSAAPVHRGPGLSSYPHPWLMPDFWQFPTGSMGLGPIQAIYQARFMKYLAGRGILDTAGRKVWAFVGDGEMDEPESLAGLSLAAREGLDNLIVVVNCNLQRLDGPVRGNGSVIQELEGLYRGRRLERGEVVVGLGLGCAVRARRRRHTAAAPARDRGRRVPDLRRHRRPLQPRAFLQQVSGTARAGRAHVRRGDRPPAPRRPRSGEDLRRVSRGHAAPRPAHGDPGADQEGLRHGPLGPGQDEHAPAEETRRRGAARVSRSLRAATVGRGPRAGAFFQAGRGHAGDAVSARAPPGAGRLPAGALKRRAEARGAGAAAVRQDARGLERARTVHHHGVRAACWRNC